MKGRQSAAGTAKTHPLDAVLKEAQKKLDALKQTARDVKTQLKQAKKAVKRAAKAARRALKADKAADSAAAESTPKETPKETQSSTTRKKATPVKAKAVKKAKTARTANKAAPAAAKAVNRAKPAKRAKKKTAKAKAHAPSPGTAPVTENVPPESSGEADWNQDEWTAGVPVKSESRP